MLNNQMVCETYETLRKIALINRDWATLFSDKSTCQSVEIPKLGLTCGFCPTNKVTLTSGRLIQVMDSAKQQIGRFSSSSAFNCIFLRVYLMFFHFQTYSNIKSFRFLPIDHNIDNTAKSQLVSFGHIPFLGKLFHKRCS